MTTSQTKKSFKFLLSNKKESSVSSTNAQPESKKYAKINNLVYEQIELCLTPSQDYGFIIAGYCPCHVETVVENSIAFNACLQKGDLIMKVNDVNCCRARIKSILSLVKQNSNTGLKLTVYRRFMGIKRPSKVCSTSNLKIQLSKQIETKSKNIKLLAKLLRPSMWLSCAQPSNTTMSNTFISEQLPNAQENQTKCSSLAESNNEYVMCTRECCKYSNNRVNSTEKIVKSDSAVDTGYETLSRYNETSERVVRSSESSNDDFSIDTVTNTTNSYSECDLTTEQAVKTVRFIQENNITKRKPNNLDAEKFNQARTKLIGDLIELEANFVSYLSLAVATFSRPLRGFFIKQQDYFCLFQNIEKILVISENFLRSMDKWSAYDLYTKIGQLYTQKMSLFKDAFTIYIQGYAKAKNLLNELKSHSKQFRLFLNEVQSSNLTLSNLLDLPVVHMHKTLEIFKQIRKYTFESKRNPSEAPHIDSVMLELRKILANLDIDVNQISYECYESELDEESTTFFMQESEISSINSTIMMETTGYEYNSCCSESISSSQSTVSHSCSSTSSL